MEKFDCYKYWYNIKVGKFYVIGVLKYKFKKDNFLLCLLVNLVWGYYIKKFKLIKKYYSFKWEKFIK